MLRRSRGTGEVMESTPDPEQPTRLPPNDELFLERKSKLCCRFCMLIGLSVLFIIMMILPLSIGDIWVPEPGNQLQVLAIFPLTYPLNL